MPTTIRCNHVNIFALYTIWLTRAIFINLYFSLLYVQQNLPEQKKSKFFKELQNLVLWPREAIKRQKGSQKVFFFFLKYEVILVRFNKTTFDFYMIQIGYINIVKLALEFPLILG